MIITSSFIISNPQSLLMAGKVNISFKYWKQVEVVKDAGGILYCLLVACERQI